jgi:ParB family transcriptional regulator, chromosome partitioning protein
MAIKNRPNVSSFLSTSAKAHDTEQNLLEAQERITYLERELDNARQSLEQRVGLDKISHALVPIADIIRRPYQSRREKDARKFAELLHSIKTYGFKGSIWLQRQPDGTLRLIAGETRLDAAIEAGYTAISSDIADVDDITAVKLSRVENARRKDLNALDDTEELLYLLMLTLSKDRAEAIECLYRYKNASEGKSSISAQDREAIEAVFTEVAPDISLATFITSRLPLLKLPEDILQAYNAGQLEYTKAMALGRIQDDLVRQELLGEVLDQGLSLSALKAKITSTSGRTAIDRVNKIERQLDGLSSKSIAELSSEQRDRLKKSLLGLKTSLQKKLKELEICASLNDDSI